MDLSTFQASLTSEVPPQGLEGALLALWYAGRDDWDRAHAIAQKADSKDGDWVHAYLHRVEGDGSNAQYWYQRAGRPAANVPLEQEWSEISTALLGKAG